MKIDVTNTINSICNNIECGGLYRYDPRDIDAITNCINNKYLKSIANKSLQVFESLGPYAVRHFFGCEPRLFPTTYTFIANSLFDSNDSIPLNKTAAEYMQDCVSRYYDDHGLWKYDENKSFYVDCSNYDTPSMPLYMLARCNNLLTKIALNNNVPSFLEVSKKSLDYVFKHHTVFKHEDGSENISYYYNSIDNTINVNTEVLDWIVNIPDILTDKDLLQHFRAILKGVLNEQNEDGSWYYYAHSHINRYNTSSIIDCHHTATIIYNLIHVLHNVKNDVIDTNELKSRIINAMHFFVSGFFKENGSAKTIIGKMRNASSVQYGEALIALIDYIQFVEARDDYKLLIDKIVQKLVQLVKSDGSAPGDSKLVPININNINWGNGPVLYALTHYKYKYEC